jgi:hypothetical protein
MHAFPWEQADAPRAPQRRFGILVLALFHCKRNLELWKMGTRASARRTR